MGPTLWSEGSNQLPPSLSCLQQRKQLTKLPLSLFLSYQAFEPLARSPQPTLPTVDTSNQPASSSKRPQLAPHFGPKSIPPCFLRCELCGVLPASLVCGLYFLWHLRRETWFRQYLPYLAHLQSLLASSVSRLASYPAQAAKYPSLLLLPGCLWCCLTLASAPSGTSWLKTQYSYERLPPASSTA